MNTLVLIVATCVGLATAGRWTEEMKAALAAANKPHHVSAVKKGDQKIWDQNSGCSCSNFGCECWGKQGNVMVNVSLVYDELFHDSDKEHVVGRFWVGDVTFEKIWCVNKVEDFCEVFNGKNFCFKVEVDDHGEDHLEGCIGMTKPHVVPMGCFKLPL